MPRAGLSPDVVVRTGAALADEVGWDALTLALVAERVGVRLPSLYKHIQGLDGLRAAIGVLALDELGERLATAAVGRSGRDALHRVAAAYRDYALAHPGRYAATVRAPAAEDAARIGAAEKVMATVLALLAGYGLEGDAAVDAARAIRAALHGFASLEGAGGFGIPRDVRRSFERMVDGLDVALVAAAPAGLPRR